jgi:hypothetical protein
MGRAVRTFSASTFCCSVLPYSHSREREEETTVSYCLSLEREYVWYCSAITVTESKWAEVKRV